MAKTCSDCLFYIVRDDYCNKNKRHVEIDDPICNSFISDDMDRCEDCSAGKGNILGFYCTKNGKFISQPFYYRCNRFQY